MPKISDIDLKLARSTTHKLKEEATITFNVTFSPREIEANVAYICDVQLYEIDLALDYYYRGLHNIRIIGHTERPKELENSKDEYEGLIAAGKIIHPSDETRTYEFQKVWDFKKGGERGKEKYRALISLTPDLETGTAWSEDVQINLVD